MRNTAFILLLGITAAAGGPTVAQEISGDANPAGGKAESSQIQWEARWTGDADAPVDAGAPDDAAIAAEAANAGGGPPTPIVPTAYSAGGTDRPSPLR